jgi:RNA polymerase sigma-70 factor (ECF subfamily)
MNNDNRRTTRDMERRIAESRDRLFRVAVVWCGDKMLADDLVQETMTSGIVHRRQLRDDKRLLAWLYSIMRNNWYRHLRQNKPLAELDDQLPSEDFGPLGACQKLEIVDRVRRAVAMLPAEQREVLSLVDLEEFSYCEVAEVLSIPIGTVMSRLHRARNNLLLQLDETAEKRMVSKDNIRIIK